jgi:hypothetical protein
MQTSLFAALPHHTNPNLNKNVEHSTPTPPRQILANSLGSPLDSARLGSAKLDPAKFLLADDLYEDRLAAMSDNEAEPFPPYRPSLTPSPKSQSSNPLEGLTIGRGQQPETVECPRCRKRAIVRRSPNVFNCLNCNFQKEFPPLSPTDKQLAALKGLNYYGLKHPYSGLSAYSSPDESPESEENSALHPLVFAVVAVIVGILLL